MTKSTSEIPGPGAYRSFEKMGREAPKFTMNGRSNINNCHSPSPGPAAYNPSKHIRNTYSFSYIKNNDSFGLEKKISENYKSTPGPGQYNIDDNSKILHRGGPIIMYLIKKF